MVQDMLDYEIKAHKIGYKIIAGVDEAGRGPLAGPVVAAVVVLNKNMNIEGLDDSKKLSIKRREKIFPKIREMANGIAIVGQEIIDEINILQATKLAMKQAIDKLIISPDIILIDGNQQIDTQIKQWTIVKGDAKSFSIAAASILAKVTRDRIMEEYHHRYPQYEFSRHKGYGTKRHRELIATHGPCPIHRKTFRGVSEYINR